MGHSQLNLLEQCVGLSSLSAKVYNVAIREPQFLTLGTATQARDIAYHHDAASRPDRVGLFWLSGFMSDMASTKASALADYAHRHDLECTRFDYSGHGLSGGDFIDGTIGRWLEEARTIFTQITTGPQVVIGSSMGGHIALMLLKNLRDDAFEKTKPIKGLILIAPAWDMTEELMWKKFPEAARRDIIELGFHNRPSAYAEPYTITRALIEDGRRHLLAREAFDPGCHVIILQGLQDPDVPATHTRELVQFLKGSSVELIEIADGEHRLSRPEDLEKLYAAVATLVAR